MVVGLLGGQEKEWMGCFLDDLRAFDINADQWTTIAQSKRELRRTPEHGAECFIRRLTAAEIARARLRRAVVCVDWTGMTKERITQSKRVRTGSLAIAD